MSSTSKTDSRNQNVDYEKLIEEPDFKNLVKRKNKFMTPFIIFFFAAYALMPILTGYTTILENRAIGWITWTWIYAFGMFIMVWTFATIYAKKSGSFDEEADELISKHIVNK